ncbi:MAG: hypothetical protein COV52_04735 [Gammaproteobacteria bacterium CG11_big_fil_rev_8_21_14_0_20_46_22]|nr:MAG: hypothetical protein COW05_02065 [Gammaproteobacteria bacterium CG12_big_fil_rev_8_21_14_0_65_46_12]PIR11287.1 MAG: hypothetical protein COV52_04735 [Gammaproteobacteria bacterium CG11_big_fil_rev_8_21_14_0_20_46_22]
MKKALFFALIILTGSAFALNQVSVQLTRLASSFSSDINAFQHFQPPVYREGYYAFIGSDHGATSLGIFSNINGNMQDIATDQTHLPGGAGQFVNFGGLDNQGRQLLSINKHSLAFEGNGRFGQTGLYLYSQGQLALIANEKTPVPNSAGTFNAFMDPGLMLDKSVGFIAQNSDNTQGIYLANPQGLLHKLVNTQTTMPHSQSQFEQFSHLEFSRVSTAKDTDFAFVGKGAGKEIGVYRDMNGKITLIANENTQLPDGGTGFFTGFGDLAYDANTQGVAFIGNGILGQTGLYYNDGKQTVMLANHETFIPQGIGHFIAFSHVIATDHLIVFHGDGHNGQKGVYVYTSKNGGIYKILSTGDTADGKKIKNVMIANESMTDTNLALLVIFENGKEALYVASLTLPAIEAIPNLSQNG